jgi:hypothetical protein
MNLRCVVDDVRTAARMPRLRVVLSRGLPHEEALLRSFRGRHPRYKVVRFKAVGVALLPLGDLAGRDDYLATRRYARRRVARAERLGYTFALFEPEQRSAELLAIHASIPERQGRPIDPDYFDTGAVRQTGPHIEHAGVLQDGVVVAYSRLHYAGDIVAMMRVMGHGDHLDNGVMFLLAAGIVGHLKATHPQTRYVFYDTFFGAGPGLRSFKERLGFMPHYVRWTREAPRA